MAPVSMQYLTVNPQTKISSENFNPFPPDITRRTIPEKDAHSARYVINPIVAQMLLK